MDELLLLVAVIAQALLMPQAFLQRYNISGYVLDYEATNVLRWQLIRT